MTFQQASWNEPLLSELSHKGARGHIVASPSLEESRIAGDAPSLLPKELAGLNLPRLPELSEPEVTRHFTRLSQMNYGIDLGIYPLGSCTMKYNPKICEEIGKTPKIEKTHPLQNSETVQGTLSILYELAEILAEITGFDKVSLQPSAGAQAEYFGCLIIRAYHREKGSNRQEMLVSDAAHGTNSASAAMAGYRVVYVPTRSDGMLDLEALARLSGPETAGLMITNPNTLGIFESQIEEISRIVHEAGGLLYYDGANLNAILGRARPREMGFDMAHINIHKTFSTPHGGGGPGAGPLAVIKELQDFLPVPTIEFEAEKYFLDYNRPKSVGKAHGFYGNVGILLRAYAYILSLGAEGLRKVSGQAVLHSNYIMKMLIDSKLFRSPFTTNLCKHEFVVSGSDLVEETGVRIADICKRAMDYGVHAPTMYFPQIVSDALMVEPTETESVREMDRLVEALTFAAREAYERREEVLKAPRSLAVSRVDEVRASHPRSLKLHW